MRGIWTVFRFKGVLARKSRAVFLNGGGGGSVDTPMHTVPVYLPQIKF